MPGSPSHLGLTEGRQRQGVQQAIWRQRVGGSGGQHGHHMHERQRVPWPPQLADHPAQRVGAVRRVVHAHQQLAAAATSGARGSGLLPFLDIGMDKDRRG
jgi:hypothetical protein